MSFYTIISITLALLLIRSSRAQFLDLPSTLAQCQTANLQWTASEPPYLITVLDASSSAPALERLWPTNDTTASWLVDVAAGTSISFALQDGAGNQLTGLPVQIVSSGDSSCLDAAAAITIPVSSGSASSANAGLAPTALLTADVPGPTTNSIPSSSVSLSIDPDLPDTSDFNTGASPTVFLGPVVSASGTVLVTITAASAANLNSGAAPSRAACLITLLSLSAASLAALIVF